MMPVNNRTKPDGPMQQLQTTAATLLFITRVLATPLEVCLRRNFGERYFRWQAVICLAIEPLWIGFWPYKDPAYLVGFWWVLVVMFIRARIECVRLARKGVIGHTRYNGHPRLLRIFRKTPEAEIKAMHEPGFGLLAGGLITHLNEPLGSLLVVSAFALFIVQATIESVERARATELNDALIEQQHLAERFRELSGRR